MQTQHFPILSPLGIHSRTFTSDFSHFQSAPPAELWRIVHDAYGEELGLTSDDDEDYVYPFDEPEGAQDGKETLFSVTLP